MHRFLRLLLVSFSLMTAGTAMAVPPPLTVAVLPFTKLKGDKTLWLDKAIADLVAQKLAESPDVAVLNRDALQAFLKEMQFQHSGFVGTKDGVARVGKIAKAEQVIYGSYAVEAGRIAIHLSIMQVNDQKPLDDYNEEGQLSDIVAIAEKLAGDVLAGRGSKPKNASSFTPTDSITALEHFYDGIRFYDEGDYEQAMGEFFAATRQDPHYLDAKLWFARMLEQLGKDEQAILAYQKLYVQKPESIEAIDAQYFAARLMAKSRPAEAVKLLHTLSTIQPEIPETIEAAYAEARLQRKLGNMKEAYALFKQIDDYSEKVRKHVDAFQQKQAVTEASFARGMALEWRRIWLNKAEEESQETQDIKHIAGLLRQSRFFGWEHSLGLYRDAITAMVELYPDLPPPTDANAIAEPPPRGSFIVDPANPVIAGDVKRKETSLFGGDHTFIPEWSEMFYALIIPKGYVATGIDLQITGHLPEPNEARDFTLRVMPFPLKENYQNSWLGVIFGQTQTTTTLNKHIPFFGRKQRLMALQLVENHGHIDHWQVKLTLAKQTEPEAELPSASAVAMDGALLARVRLGDKEARTIRTQPQYIMQWLPKQKLALANNYNDGLWLVGVKGDLLGEETNLWQTHSEDGGKHWSPSELMTVNSSSLEFSPTLIRREDGGLQLFFLSDRRGLGWELWTSEQDRKNKRWSNPRIVPLRDTAATGFEDVADLSAAILPYSVIQDNHGVWKVAFYSRVTKKIQILSSDDLDHWKQTAEIEPQGAAGIALGQDLTGRYYLIDVDSSGKPRIYTSNDAISWQSTSMISKQYSDPKAIATYPITLLPEKNAVTLVFSDVYTGLQYARIGPDQAAVPDLVTQSALDTYAIATTDEGYITAQWKDDDIHIQHFNSLAFPSNPENSANELIYTERSKGAQGGVWDRIFARERYRVPDVTAIAAAPDGHIWWGIETGIMALKDKDFFLADVSDGFFYHFVDQITHCGDKVWFASSMLAPARVGFNHGDAPNRASLGKSISLGELPGPVNAMTCGEGGDMYFSSVSGIFVAVGTNEEHKVFTLPGEKDVITSLAYDGRAKRLLVGTQQGVVYRLDSKGAFTSLYQKQGHAIDALVADNQGNIWVAVHNDGLHVFDPAGKQIKHYTQAAVYSNLHKLVADRKNGVWAAADCYSSSPGLIHADLKAINLHNPPQKLLGEIIDFDIAVDGSLWIGTNLDGIYHYRRAP